MQLKFNDFMNLLNRSDELGANFYLEYFPIKEVPAMMNDIQNFDFAEYSSFINYFIDYIIFYIISISRSLLRRDMFNVWVGNGRTLGKLHFDPYDNLLVMIAGTSFFDLPVLI